MDDLNKLKEDFEYEKANIRVNYMLNIFAVLSYLIFDKIGEIVINGNSYNAHWGTIMVIAALLIFFYKEISVYSKKVIKKYVFGVK